MEYGKRPVRFEIGDVGPFYGFTDNTTWNGWMNIWVKPETHEKVLAAFPDDEELAKLTVGDDSFISYANAYCTSEWDDDEPTPYQAWTASRQRRDDLGQHVDGMDGSEGMTYRDGAWIEVSKNNKGERVFSTLVGVDEFESPHLGVVEWWLWNQWSESQNEVKKKRTIANVTEAAQNAFWKVVAESYPEIKSGDFPPVMSATTSAVMESAVTLWVVTNGGTP